MCWCLKVWLESGKSRLPAGGIWVSFARLPPSLARQSSSSVSGMPEEENRCRRGVSGWERIQEALFFWLKVLPELLGPAQRLETRACDWSTVYTTNNKLPSFAYGHPLLPPTPFELGFAALQRGPPKSGPLEAVRLSLQGSLPCPGSQRWLHSRSPCPEETEAQGGIGMKSRGRRRRRMSPRPQEENTHGFPASSATSCAALGVV